MVLTAVMIQVGLCVPVVLDLAFSAFAGGSHPRRPSPSGPARHLADSDLFGPAMAVGVAVALEFSRMSSEGMIAVFYSLKLSVWSICLPAAVVGFIAVILGYFLSSVVAPAYVGQMHDVIYVVRNSLNHRMLEPAKFYTFDND